MNITEVLDELGIKWAEGGTHRHVTHGWAGADCSRCSPDSGLFKLGINLESGGCSCWSCGVMPLAEALAESSGRTIREVRQLLGTFDRQRRGDDPPVRGKLFMPAGVGPLNYTHRTYLKGRGFDPAELSRLWGVQGIGIAVDLAWRLWLPITFRGKTVSWTTRTVIDAEPRYVGARPKQEAMRAKSLIYGMDLVRHAVIICEGPMDAIRIGPGAVATMGVIVTGAQALALSRIPVRTVAFDSEPKAQERAKRLVEILAGFPGVTRRVEIDAADPGSASPDEVALLRREFL